MIRRKEPRRERKLLAAQQETLSRITQTPPDSTSEDPEAQSLWPAHGASQVWLQALSAVTQGPASTSASSAPPDASSTHTQILSTCAVHLPKFHPPTREKGAGFLERAQTQPYASRYFSTSWELLVSGSARSSDARKAAGILTCKMLMDSVSTYRI